MWSPEAQLGRKSLWPLSSAGCLLQKTERPTKRRENLFLSFDFEDVVEEEETEEGRGAARSSEDRDGSNTARDPPTLQCSRDKSCGGAISTPGLGWGQDPWGG